MSELLETLSRAREIRYSMREARLDPVQKIVRGAVYVPFDPSEMQDYPLAVVNDRVDTWATFIRSDTLKKLAYDYLDFYRNVDKRHDRQTRAGSPVESYISDGSDGHPKGAWIMAVRVSDSVWPEVQRRELTGFSIDVLARRKPTAVRVTGNGDTIDLTGVSQYPYMPKRVVVRGMSVLRLDELLDLQPNFVSIVDRAANRRTFEQRMEAMRRAALFADPLPEMTIVRCQVQVPGGPASCHCETVPANRAEQGVKAAPAAQPRSLMGNELRDEIIGFLDSQPGLVRITKRNDGSTESVEVRAAAQLPADPVASAPPFEERGGEINGGEKKPDGAVLVVDPTQIDSSLDAAVAAISRDTVNGGETKPSGSVLLVRGAVPYAATPEAKGGTWDADAAVQRLRKWASSDGSGDKDKMDWAKYAQGFAAIGDPA